MKLNNKGFTLIEVLAVVVILSILMAIMVPSVNTLIKRNESDNRDKLEKNILSAAKLYLSDYRYEVVIEGACATGDVKKRVQSIGGQNLDDNKLFIQYLVEGNYLKIPKGNCIMNPQNKTQCLSLDSSYVIVEYSCKTKDFLYILEDDSLKWELKK